MVILKAGDVILKLYQDCIGISKIKDKRTIKKKIIVFVILLLIVIINIIVQRLFWINSPTEYLNFKSFHIKSHFVKDYNQQLISVPLPIFFNPL